MADRYLDSVCTETQTDTYYITTPDGDVDFRVEVDEYDNVTFRVMSDVYDLKIIVEEK